MNGPRILCAGCGEPTRGINAICDKCMTPPEERCLLCEQGYARDKWGIHTTKTGGYVGKCHWQNPPPPTSSASPSFPETK